MFKPKTVVQTFTALCLLCATTVFAQAPNYTVSTIYTGPDREQIGELDLDKDGNIYFVNRTAVTISKLMADGTTTVLAGGGTTHNLLVAFILQSDTFPAIEAALGIITNVAVDQATGNAYLQIGKITWKLTPDGQLTRFAGQKAITAPAGLTGFDGPAIDGTIPQPGGDGGAAIGPDGSIYLRTGVADPRIVKIDSMGIMTHYAGNGERGNAGDGGPATSAQLYGLGAIATDTAGNLYLAEAEHGIRKISTDGTITTIVGSTDPNSRKLDKNEIVNGIDPLSVRFSDILFISASPDGSIFFAESARDVVYQLTPDGKVTTIAGDGTDGHSGDGGPATAAQFNSIWGLTSDSAGNVYVTEGVSPRYIRKLTTDTPLQTGGGDTGGTGGTDTGTGGGTTFTNEQITRADFSGDGEIGFTDFLAFANAFGKTSADADFNATIDLNDDGSVNFPDFLLFTQLFGQKVSGKPATKSIGQYLGTNTEATLALLPQAGKTTDQVTLSVKLNDFQWISAYNLTLNYDTAALQLMRAENAHPSRLTQSVSLQPVALQILSTDGGLVLSDVFESPIQTEGTLLNLTFQVIDIEAISGIEISNVLIADVAGHINALQGARLTDLNPVPAEFALNQNHPNPFNPDTQIGYQLPQSGDVSLTIYNLLGQQVRQLVNTPQAAGFYRVSWNGQDALGRSAASGIYFYHLNAAQFSQTKMMILLK